MVGKEGLVMKAKKKEKNKSLSLGFYFGFFVLLIIVISLIFKMFDVARKSKFDGNNRFTVAIMYKDSSDIVSISPREGTLTRLSVEGATNPKTLRNLSIPIDSYIKAQSQFSQSPKLIFAKMLINKKNLETDLNVLDLLKLSIRSLGIDEQRIREESSSMKKAEPLLVLISGLFTDETISTEKINIQITNATQVSGLGNKIAKYLTNMGGSVVLVSSSKEIEGESKIIYKGKSYTVRKISQIMDLPLEKKEMNSITDIIIIIGRDKEEF